jgi:HEXXH motif-containing protein
MASLPFVEPERVEESTRALIAATGVGGGRLAYFEALNRIQSRPIRLDDVEAPPRSVFEFEHSEDRRIVEHFLEGETAGAAHLFGSQEREEIGGLLADASALLAEFDEGVPTMVEALVARVFFARKAGFGGASTADMLGCVWLSPPRGWEAVDFAEAIYHETVHQALFLEEMVHGVYTVAAKEMLSTEARVVSAIRREKRPFDASFHAACVAAALLDLYRELDRPERVGPLVEGLRPSVEEMAEKDAYLNENGRQILDRLQLSVA